MRTRYMNGVLVDASGERQDNFIIENGMICEDSPYCENAVDLAGLTVMPALVDMHCHLRDPGYPQKETMETGMRAALKGGYATLTAMANTQPVMETPELVLANLAKAKKLGLCRLIQSAAAGKDLGDEIATDRAALAKVTKVITNDGKTIFSDAFMRQLLIDSQRYGFLISTHCQPERATVERDIRLLREVGGNLHVGHISRRETVEMIREAKADGLKLTCEVTPHHLFGYDSDYKVNPPFRTKEDVDALIHGIKDGTIDCLATDHAPHTEVDKAVGMAGIDNIEYALQIFLKVFWDHGIPLTRLSKMASFRPAWLLRTGAGMIQFGRPADLVVIHPGAEGTINTTNMISRSHNTPFDGRKVRGSVIMTIVGGKILYDHRQAL